MILIVILILENCVLSTQKMFFVTISPKNANKIEIIKPITLIIPDSYIIKTLYCYLNIQLS